LARRRGCRWRRAKRIYLERQARFITRYYCERVGEWCGYAGREWECPYSLELGQRRLL